MGCRLLGLGVKTIAHVKTLKPTLIQANSTNGRQGIVSGFGSGFWGFGVEGLMLRSRERERLGLRVYGLGV